MATHVMGKYGFERGLDVSDRNLRQLASPSPLSRASRRIPIQKLILTSPAFGLQSSPSPHLYLSLYHIWYRGPWSLSIPYMVPWSLSIYSIYTI